MNHKLTLINLNSETHSTARMCLLHCHNISSLKWYRLLQFVYERSPFLRSAVVYRIIPINMLMHDTSLETQT